MIGSEKLGQNSTSLQRFEVVCSFVYGFALGPLFPGALLVAEASPELSGGKEKLAPEPLDGRSAGFTVACAALGEMLLPLLTGLCFDWDAASFGPVQLAVCSGALLIFQDKSASKYTSVDAGVRRQFLTVDSITPSEGSKGGLKARRGITVESASARWWRRVTIAGKGFSSTPARHFIRVGSDFWSVCEPMTSNYYGLTCRLNYQALAQASANGGSITATVMLWDTQVAKDPLSAFGNSQAGCLRNNNDVKTYYVQSQEECALRCLTTDNCKSFDYSGRYQRCFMARTSFTNCADCLDAGQTDCRYWERRTESSPEVEVAVSEANVFTYQTSLTPTIEQVYTLPSTMRPELQGTATNCGSDAGDLTSGNSGCCTTSAPCGVDEGVCSSDTRCASYLQCVSDSCSAALGRLFGALDL
ncbi:unnamed protein product [Effrenium voratum]|nr:unnamed protein product [Effrenium voratum]